MSQTETLPKELREAEKKNASKGTEMNPQITNTLPCLCNSIP